MFHRTVIILGSTVLAAALVAGCGGSDTNDKKSGSASTKTHTLKTGDLKAGVITPLDLASYTAAAVLSCHSEMSQKTYKLGTDPDCTDAAVLKKINPTSLADLSVGLDPGQVDINIVDAQNFTVTARSIDIDGPGMILWKYGMESGNSNYIGSCEPNIKDYCKDGKIVEYASSKAAEKVAQAG